MDSAATLNNFNEFEAQRQLMTAKRAGGNFGGELKRRGRGALARTAQKFLPQDIREALEEDDFAEAMEGLAHSAGRFAGNYAKNKLFKKYVADKLKAAAKEAARKAITQATLNRVKIWFGVTMIGLIVTYLIMTVQMIWGNWKHSKLIPSLYIWEQILWWFATVILFLALLINIFMNIISFAIYLGPIVAVGYFGNQLFDIIKNLF